MQFLKKSGLLAIGSLVLLLAATTGVFAQDPANGKVLFEETVFQCQKCHGLSGEGLWAGPLAGTDKTADEWLDQVHDPKKRMPHFSAEQVSDAMIIDMQAYMAGLPAPTAEFSLPDPGLPADAPEGQQLLVAKKCVACHTTTGPINGFIKRGEMPTAEAVVKQLRTPFKNMPSFTPEQISDDEAALVADFLASQVTPDNLPATGAAAEGSSRTPGILLAGLVLLVMGAGLGLVSRRAAMVAHRRQ